jgi:CyaY protein
LSASTQCQEGKKGSGNAARYTGFKVQKHTKDSMSSDGSTGLQYAAESNRLLARVEQACDRWLETDHIDIDTHRSGGMLELTLPDHSKIIINTQPPLQEIWLAARAGGFHFKWQAGQWVGTRDGEEFFACLSRLGSAQAGAPLEF